MLTPSFDRLEEAIDQITSALLARDLERLPSLNAASDRHLAVLFSQIARMNNAGIRLDEFEQDRYNGLMGKMEVNLELVREHMSETAQVKDIVAAATSWDDVAHLCSVAPEMLEVA
jgi:hypothetical protein